MRVLLFVAIFTVLFPVSTRAQTPTPEEQEVWQAVKACWAAMAQKDEATFMGCFHEDYNFWWSEDALPFGKDVVREVGAVVNRTLDIVFDDVRPAKIVVKGNVAIVHWGARRFIRGEGGVPEVAFVERASMTLVKEEGRWLWLGGGGSPVK
jgi:ketosteroid isomerase-like protein